MRRSLSTVVCLVGAMSGVFVSQWGDTRATAPTETTEQPSIPPTNMEAPTDDNAAFLDTGWDSATYFRARGELRSADGSELLGGDEGVVDPLDGTVVVRSTDADGTTVGESARFADTVVWRDGSSPDWDFAPYADFAPLFEPRAAPADPLELSEVTGGPVLWDVGFDRGLTTQLTAETVSAVSGIAADVPVTIESPTSLVVTEVSWSRWWAGTNLVAEELVIDLTQDPAGTSEAILIYSTAFHVLDWHRGIPASAHLELLNLQDAERAFADASLELWGPSGDARAPESTIPTSDSTADFASIAGGRDWRTAWRPAGPARDISRALPAVSRSAGWVPEQSGVFVIQRPTGTPTQQPPPAPQQPSQPGLSPGTLGAAVTTGLAIGGAVGYLLYSDMVQEAFRRLGEAISAQVEHVADILEGGPAIAPAPSVELNQDELPTAGSSPFTPPSPAPPPSLPFAPPENCLKTWSERRGVLRTMNRDVHHIGSEYRDEFIELFDEYGMDVNDNENLKGMTYHRGPHPVEYHGWIWSNLATASTAEEFIEILDDLAEIINDDPTILVKEYWDCYR